ncbi:DUF397 domain-containing protein [[Kitasatospora] papulosa]|uniref:DUF397 domain-containing protein n=1 Tax=Streptomyces TaxID=1883 RepID=UPI0033FC7DCD
MSSTSPVGTNEFSKPAASELDLSAVTWRTTSFTGGNDNCFEFGRAGEWIVVRDTFRREDAPQVYSKGELKALIDGAIAGDLDYLLA